MRADMLVPLAELPGFDPVGLRVHGAEFPTSPFGLAVDASGWRSLHSASVVQPAGAPR